MQSDAAVPLIRTLAEHEIVRMIGISHVLSDEDLMKVNQLTLEYLQWCVEEARIRLGEELDVDVLYKHALSDQKSFMSDTGRLFLAKVEGADAGIACLRKLREEVCEVKRMYVRPLFRGKKIGELLLSRLIEEARTIGYSKVLLDSDSYMVKAHAVYKAMGFVETLRYPESKMSGYDYAQHMIYMEMVL
jgi:GNAT superfamily N-acetyltransferase